MTYVQHFLQQAHPSYGVGEPASIAVSLDGRHVYVASFDHLAVAALERDRETGWLSYAGDLPAGRPGMDGFSGASFVTVSPDGGHVYVTGSYDHAVAVFERHPGTGDLTFLEAQFEDLYGLGGAHGLFAPNTVIVSPDGGHVYAAGATSGRDAVSSLAVFARHHDLGTLTFVEAVAGDELGELGTLFSSLSSVAISPDGRFVYVAPGIATLERDPGTGELTLSEVQLGGLDVLGLSFWAHFVTVSPDGQNLYAAGRVPTSPYPGTYVVVALERAPSTGELVFLEAHVDELNGVEGLRGAESIAVSPDGSHVYVASNDDDAVAIFERQAGTGALSFVEALYDGEGGVDGLDGARSVAIGADGRQVYVASDRDHALAVFGRDPVTGSLTFVEAHLDDVDGVDGLLGATSVAVSPDSKGVYVASAWESAVSSFSRSCRSGPETLCLGDQRFQIEVEWHSFDGTTGSGKAVAVGSEDSGLLWFFEADNWEMLVKVLDGCAFNDRFWVFAAATTTVEYTLRVTDTATGAVREYFKPLGTAAAAITDTDAFAACSAAAAGSAGSVS